MRLNGLTYPIPQHKAESIRVHLAREGIEAIDPSDPLGCNAWKNWCQAARKIDNVRAERVESFVKEQSDFDTRLAEKLIDKIVAEDPVEFLGCCFSLDHQPTSGERVVVPPPLRSIAYHTSRYGGTTLGRGELSAYLISGSAEFRAGEREDITIWDEAWHVKESDASFRMNKAKGYAFTGSNVHSILISTPVLRATGLSETLNGLRARRHTELICETFGSVENLLERTREEMIVRVFHRAVGICVFDPEEWTLTFWRRKDILLAEVRDGGYRAKVPGRRKTT